MTLITSYAVEHENFESRWGVRSLNSGKSLEMNKGRFGKRKGRNALYMRNTGSFHNTSKFLATTGSSAGDAKEKVRTITIRICKEYCFAIVLV